MFHLTRLIQHCCWLKLWLQRNCGDSVATECRYDTNSNKHLPMVNSPVNLVFQWFLVVSQPPVLRDATSGRGPQSAFEDPRLDGGELISWSMHLLQNWWRSEQLDGEHHMVPPLLGPKIFFRSMMGPLRNTVKLR